MADSPLVGVSDQGAAHPSIHRWLRHENPVPGYASACGFQFCGAITECAADAPGYTSCIACFPPAMNAADAAGLLQVHNEQVRAGAPLATDPRRLGQAIDIAVEVLTRESAP